MLHFDTGNYKLVALATKVQDSALTFPTAAEQKIGEQAKKVLAQKASQNQKLKQD